MKVVVIGGTGHIGTYLVPRLIGAGHHVTVITRGGRKPYSRHVAWDRAEMVEADREVEDEAGKFAGRVAALEPQAVIDLYCFTVRSGEQIIEALSPSKAYLLHCGTIWTHGPLVEAPVAEEAVKHPIGEYGKQKALIEELVLAESLRGTLPATVLHPGHIVGPGWPPLNPAANFNLSVFERLARGEELSLPNFGLETIHHVHADDVAQAFQLALARPAAAHGEAFHVVSERTLTLRGYAEAVSGWFGRPANLSFEPWDKWASGWDAEDSRTTWEHIARSPSMSIEKAKRLLGYQPRYTSLEAVLDALVWQVANGRVDFGGRVPSM